MKNRISFSTDLKNLSLAENFVELVSEKYEISADVYGNIVLSVLEAVNNAIVHGNKMDFNKLIHLEADYENSTLTFVVTDEGEGFDYNNIPDPTSPENIEKINGRGIFLIRQLADTVQFEKGGTQLIISFNV